jgi:hypothetical protein
VPLASFFFRNCSTTYWSHIQGSKS